MNKQILSLSLFFSGIVLAQSPTPPQEHALVVATNKFIKTAVQADITPWKARAIDIIVGNILGIPFKTYVNHLPLSWENRSGINLIVHFLSIGLVGTTRNFFTYRQLQQQLSTLKNIVQKNNHTHENFIVIPEINPHTNQVIPHLQIPAYTKSLRLLQNIQPILNSFPDELVKAHNIIAARQKELIERYQAEHPELAQRISHAYSH